MVDRDTQMEVLRDVPINGVYGLSVSWQDSKNVVRGLLGLDDDHVTWNRGPTYFPAVECLIPWAVVRTRDNASRAGHAYCTAKHRVVGSLRWAGWMAWTVVTCVAIVVFGFPAAIHSDIARLLGPLSIATAFMAYSTASAGLATAATAAAFGIKGVARLPHRWQWCELLRVDTGVHMDRFSEVLDRVASALDADARAYVVMQRPTRRGFEAEIDVGALAIHLTSRASKVHLLVERRRRSRDENVDGLISALRECAVHKRDGQM